MALYAISDLHLPLGVNKPMDIFGPAWKDYVYRLKSNWQAHVKEDDYIVIPGDFSWALQLDEAKRDFDFISRLPGVKILLKGNHDYWWDTMAKLKRFVIENAYTNIHFLHNNSFLYQNTSICGTRFWVCPGTNPFTEQDEKIYLRELGRAQLSLESAKKQNPDEIIFFTHYPPFVNASAPDPKFLELMKSYNIKRVLYGHIHGSGKHSAFTGKYNDITFDLVSCDYLQFMPLKIKD